VVVHFKIRFILLGVTARAYIFKPHDAAGELSPSTGLLAAYPNISQTFNRHAIKLLLRLVEI
jgi:hypothetical protein